MFFQVWAMREFTGQKSPRGVKGRALSPEADDIFVK